MDKKSPGRRLLIAIPMAIVFLAAGVAVYLPGMFVGGMMTDSCSGGNAYTMWNVWLVYLWPVVLLAAALVPAILVFKGRPWKNVLISIAAGAAAGLAWFLLWIPLLAISGC